MGRALAGTKNAVLESDDVLLRPPRTGMIKSKHKYVLIFHVIYCLLGEKNHLWFSLRDTPIQAIPRE